MIERRQQVFSGDLRRLRRDAGFKTGKVFADRIGWLASKVSRIENARTLPADADLDEWFDAVGADEDTAMRLRAELIDLRLERDRWKQQLRHGHFDRQRTEAVSELEATSIVSVELYLVNGLVQIPAYAHRVFELAAEMHGTPADTPEAVRERIRRQDVLYDPSKQIEILIGESALRYPICATSILRAQIARLINLVDVGLDHVRFGIVPLDTPLPTITMHGFTIHDDTVIVEVNHTELIVADPDDVEFYKGVTAALWDVAVEKDQARALLGRIAADLR